MLTSNIPRMTGLLHTQHFVATYAFINMYGLIYEV